MLKPLAPLPKFPEAFVLAPKVHKDHRGHFLESFLDYELRSLKITNKPFVQDNESFSVHGVLRGLHFQKVHPQEKLVRVVKGQIWDVIVDIRPSSATFGQWDSVVLDDKDHCMLFVPIGFAHGFVVLSVSAYVTYKCTDYYYADDQYGVLFCDHDLNIPWQDKLTSKLTVSEQDQRWPTLTELHKELSFAHGQPTQKYPMSKL